MQYGSDPIERGFESAQKHSLFQVTVLPFFDRSTCSYALCRNYSSVDIETGRPIFICEAESLRGVPTRGKLGGAPFCKPRGHHITVATFACVSRCQGTPTTWTHAHIGSDKEKQILWEQHYLPSRPTALERPTSNLYCLFLPYFLVVFLRQVLFDFFTCWSSTRLLFPIRFQTREQVIEWCPEGGAREYACTAVNPMDTHDKHPPEQTAYIWQCFSFFDSNCMGEELDAALATQTYSAHVCLMDAHHYWIDSNLCPCISTAQCFRSCSYRCWSSPSTITIICPHWDPSSKLRKEQLWNLPKWKNLSGSPWPSSWDQWHIYRSRQDVFPPIMR